MCNRATMWLCGHYIIEPENEFTCYSQYSDCDEVITQCGVFTACISCQTAGVRHTMEEWREIAKKRDEEAEAREAERLKRKAEFLRKTERSLERFRHIWRQYEKVKAQQDRRRERARRMAEESDFYESDSDDVVIESPPYDLTPPKKKFSETKFGQGLKKLNPRKLFQWKKKDTRSDFERFFEDY